MGYLSKKTPPEQLFDGRYEIISTVGHGRNSIVYRAKIVSKSSKQFSSRLREVALKVLTSNPKEPQKNLQIVRHEALAMLCSQHPNVIRLHDYIATEDVCYLAMEFAERGDLRRELARSGGALPPRIVLHLLHQLLAGLEAIHDAGIVHRDIKPENILVTSAGNVRIADFGIAALPSAIEEEPSAHLGVGTFDYLAPELLDKGESSFASDIYAVGVTAYELLTGKVPFGGETLTEQINNKLSGKRVTLETLLGHPVPLLDSILEKALAIDPKQRFKSAAEFRYLIRHLCDKHWDTLVVSSPANERKFVEQVAQNKSTLMVEQSTYNALQGKTLLRKNKFLRKLRLLKVLRREEKRAREKESIINKQAQQSLIKVSESTEFNTTPQLIARVKAVPKSKTE